MQRARERERQTHVARLPDVLRPPRVDRPSSSAPSSPPSSSALASASLARSLASRSSCSLRLSGKTPPFASIKLARMASSSPASAWRELSVDRRLTGDFARFLSDGGGEGVVREEEDGGGRAEDPAGGLDREDEDVVGAAVGAACDVDDAVEGGLARARLGPPVDDAPLAPAAPAAAVVDVAPWPPTAVVPAAAAAAAVAAAAALTLLSALPFSTGSPPLPLLLRPTRFPSALPAGPPFPSSVDSQTSSSRA